MSRPPSVHGLCVQASCLLTLAEVPTSNNCLDGSAAPSSHAAILEGLDARRAMCAMAMQSEPQCQDMTGIMATRALLLQPLGACAAFEEDDGLLDQASKPQAAPANARCASSRH
jgi:hypothetical protein